MAYSKLEPLDEDLGVSQPKIVANFTAIETYISLDHESFDDNGADAGLHTKVTLVEQAADPSVAVNKVGLYSKEIATVTELVMRRANDGTVIQMSVGDPTAASPGQTFLPGGLIMKWGSAAVDTTGTTITFAAAFPNNCFNVQVTPSSTQKRGSAVSDLAVATFKAYSENNGTTMYWTAIGN